MGNYTGNKHIPGVYQKIINEIPKHDYYLEAFAGSGAIGKLLPVHTVKHFNDLNKEALDSITVSPGSKVIKTLLNVMDLLQLFERSGTETFMFFDPPYLHSTRNSNKLYEWEMTESDHIQFISAVKKLKCNWMIIHPVCDLYEDEFPSDYSINGMSWRSIQIKIRYNTKTSIEKLYMNYPEQLLQTNKYLGKDCWDRQRIKRKAQRFMNKGLHIPFPGGTYITDIIQS